MSSLPTYYDLDPHQEDLFDAATDSLDSSGIFVSPTGSGKTFVIADTLYERALPDGGNVFVVLEPKIQLAMQQVQTFYQRLEAANGSGSETRPFRYMAVHSARTASDYLVDYAKDRGWDVGDLPTHQFTSTTNSTDIASEVNKAQNSGENIVIVSTYDSAHRISEAGVDIAHVFCDEAHHLVEADHHTVLDLFDAPYHHWTATPRYTESTDGRGMNNTEDFGHVLERVTMERIVEEGLIAKPRLNLAYGMGTNESPIENKYSVVKMIADDQEERIDYPPKIVFNCSGRDQLHALAQAAAQDERFDDYLVAAISSEDPNNDDYGSWINGEKVSRSEWLNRVNEAEGKALVFHYDVVTEGIDVPGISGTVLLRSIGSKGKNLQIMGRAMRLLENERDVPVEDRLKTHADIYVPIIEDPFDDGQDMNSQFETYKRILYALQAEGVNIDPAETRAVTQATGDSEDDENDPLDVREGEEVSDILPDDIGDLADVHNEVYENVVNDERQTYLNRLRYNSDSVLEAIDFFEQDRESILQERERAELLLEHIYNQQNEGNYPSGHEITSSTYTPPELANSQVEKLVEAGASFDGVDVLVLNPEYIVQLFRNGFRPNEITILCDDRSMKAAIRTLGMRFGIRTNIVTDTDQIDDMEFDVVVGNPPFEHPEKTGGSAKLWADFVELVNSVLTPGGFFSLIHPNGWFTNSGSKTGKIFQRLIVENNLIYLNVNDVEKHFKDVSTGDCGFYVCENEDPSGKTEIVTSNGLVEVDLRSFNRLPKKLTPKVTSIIEKTLFSDSHESFDFVKDSGKYRDSEVPTTRNDDEYVVDEKDENHQYPIVNSVYVDDSTYEKWSSVENYWQNDPKVLISQSSTYNPFYDSGEYGFTQNVTALIFDDKKKAKSSASVLSNKLYRYLVEIQKMGPAISPQSLQNLPKVDLDKDWTDEELYDHFNLSDDEIKEIESFV